MTFAPAGLSRYVSRSGHNAMTVFERRTMSQSDALTGRRLTISDLGRGSRARQAAAPVTPKPATPARSATPAPPPKPAKAKAVQQKQPKSSEQMAEAAANIERDRQQHYEAIGRRAAAITSCALRSVCQARRSSTCWSGGPHSSVRLPRSLPEACDGTSTEARRARSATSTARMPKSR
jgi:hypothetical protein